VALLTELIERYGTGAVVTVDPYTPDSSDDILRWVLLIDGEDVSDADIRVSERDGRGVMLLTGGGEEVELARWREGAPDPLVVDTLGALRRRRSRD
jgi:hypothetical protein